MPPQPPSAPPAAAPRAEAGLGLVPLPSPQQVSAAVALGRLDPFSNPVPAAVGPASLAGATPTGPSASGSAAAGAPARAGGPVAPAAEPFPADFRFTGVVFSQGHAEALVQTGSQSGSVRVGAVGVATTPWLPKGWSVTAIDAKQGALTLGRGSEKPRRFNLL